MAIAYKLNKSERTRLSRELAVFNQYLPVLKLKKERLQGEQGRLRRALKDARAQLDAIHQECRQHAALLAEPLPFDIRSLARPDKIVFGEGIVAGLRVPTIAELVYERPTPPRFAVPVWLSRLLPTLRLLSRRHEEARILERQFRIVDRELRKTTQKVNLFEKVLVPETREAIRRIGIALGDQQTASVCRAKIAKGKKIRAGEVPS